MVRSREDMVFSFWFAGFDILKVVTGLISINVGITEALS